MSTLWNVVTMTIGMLPASRAKNWLLSLRKGYEIRPDARVNPCLIRNVNAMQLGAGASIGFGNVFWNLRSVEIGDRASMGHLNWVSASPMFLRSTSQGLPVTVGRLILGSNSIIVSRHRFDCSGGIELGSWAILVGHGTEILTHSLSITDAAQVAGPVRIGDHAFVGSRVLVLKDVDITDHVVIAAGSVVPKSLDKAYGFYVGAPATWKTDVSPDVKMFHREPGFLGVRD